MKILQINSVHFPRGGADIVYLNTGKLLEKHGHKIYYFSSKGEKTLDNEYINYFYPEHDYRNMSIIKKIQNSKTFLYNKSAYDNLLQLVDVSLRDIRKIVLLKAQSLQPMLILGRKSLNQLM